jgi:hypothetical protein
VLGLEIKQYQSSDGLTTFVPNIVGNTASANQAKRQNQQKWDEDKFLQETEQISGLQAADICRKILRSVEAIGCHIWWGEGIKHGSFVPEYIGKKRHQLFSVYNSDKITLTELYFQYMKEPFNTIEYRTKHKNNLERIPGVQISKFRLDKRPNFNIELLKSDNAFTLFIDSMQAYINDIKDDEQK